MPLQVIKAGSRPPWVGLAAAVWVEVSAGNAYNFPLYSHALKSVLGFSQQQVSMLGVANDIGENLGLLPGYACNKFPPWMVLLVGVLACFLGYSFLWLSVSQTIQGVPYLVLWLALVVASNSNAWFGTAVLVTNMRNFPLSRGIVAGILKGYVGISAAVYTVLYNMVLNKSSSQLLLFLALGIPIVCLVLMYLIRPCAPASGEDSSEHVHFMFTQAASVLLAAYLLASTLLSDFVSLSNAVSYALVAVMAILMLSPLVIPIKMTLYPSRSRTRPALPSSDQLISEGNDSSQTASLLKPSSSASYLGSFIEIEDVSDIGALLAEGEGAVKPRRKPRRGEDFKFREAFVKADFWLLWLVYFLGVGSGVTVLNNLAQIGVAYGVANTTILLSIFSFCNFLGRLGSGAISEHFIKKNATPRTLWMTLTQITMVFTFILYALDLSGTLYFATVLLGICYGFQYSLMVPTASELFGLEHFGMIYNFVLLGNPVGALLFSGLLAGSLYDMEAAKQQASTCMGPDCFRLTFYILAGMCSIGTVLGVILTVRIRPVYQSLYASGSFRILPQTSDH